MLSTAASVFGQSYAITAGAKTGTASVPKGTANGIFVAFAPYDDPEIVGVCVIEEGAAGGNASKTVAEIFKAYYEQKKNFLQIKMHVVFTFTAQFFQLIGENCSHMQL